MDLPFPPGDAAVVSVITHHLPSPVGDVGAHGGKPFHHRENPDFPFLAAWKGNSRVVWFDGNYSEYDADRKLHLGASASQPHRIKYRHLRRI
jgi:hypothetical protein